MSKPKYPRVLIHLLGGSGSGRTTLLRRFLFDIFDNTYDPTLEVGPYSGRVDIGGTTVCVDLETISEGFYQHESEVERCIGPADGLISIMTPPKPSAMDKTVSLRLDVLNKAIEAKGGGLMERVVIMKDIDVSWDTDVPGTGKSDLIPDDIDDEERKRREEQWGSGAERGYELAKRLGVEAKIACPRTGEGVKEAVGGLVLQILERRKAVEEEAKRLEEEAHQADENSRHAEEKRALSYSSRLKRFLGVTKGEEQSEG